MATQPIEDNEPEDTVEDIDLPADDVDQPAPEQDDDGDEEIHIELEDADDQHGDNTPLAKKLRETIREKEEELKKLRPLAKPASIKLGPEPVWTDETQHLWDYDPQKFLDDRKAWEGQKAAKDEQDRKQQEIEASQQERQRKIQADYQVQANAFREKARLSPEEYKEREQALTDSLGTGPAADALKALAATSLEDVPLLAHAMYQYPKRAAAIAAIQDDAKRFVALVRFHDEVRSKVTTKRKDPPAVDRPQSGSARLSAGVDKELERLEKEAERTGNRSKIIAYKAGMRK